jgi:hypothetical protein
LLPFPANTGYVVGTVLFVLAGLSLGAIVFYAWWEDRRPDE